MAKNNSSEDWKMYSEIDENGKFPIFQKHEQEKRDKEFQESYWNDIRNELYLESHWENEFYHEDEYRI